MPSAIRREHVEPAVDHRGPAALEKRPPAPQHRRRRQRQLHPNRSAGPRSERCGDVLAHRDRHQRHRQRHPDPEPPRHVAQLGVGGLARQPASSARAPCRRSGSCPARCARSADASGRSTGPYRAPAALARQGVAAQITRRVGIEPLAAPAAAEMVGVARMPAVVRDATGSTVMPQTGSRTGTGTRRQDGGLLMRHRQPLLWSLGACRLPRAAKSE